ncbi:MAG: TIGR04282 family arsenosugar biosynthesis glycosyltransferase [Crocinitomicaceae bacterium]
MNAIVLFFKNPRKGHVKGRLSQQIGEDKALGVYNQLLLRTLKITRSLKKVHDVFYYCDENENVFDLDNFHVQEGGTLREHIKNAADKHLIDHDKVVLIPSDCFDLKADDLEEAFEKLDQFDVVFGPATDGGIYLIALKQEMDYLFEDIPINSTQILHFMIDELTDKGMTYSLLETRIDVDTEEDLRHTDLSY